MKFKDIPEDDQTLIALYEQYLENLKYNSPKSVNTIVKMAQRRYGGGWRSKAVMAAKKYNYKLPKP